MIDGSARRIVLAGIGCPRGDVDQGGDLRVHSHIRHDHSRKGVAYPILQISVRVTTGTVRNAAEQLGTICERATTGYVRIGDGCRVWLWRRRG